MNDILNDFLKKASELSKIESQYINIFNMKKSEPKIELLHKNLAERGWFLNMNSPFIMLNTMIDLFEKEDVNSIDIIMMSHIKDHYDTIKKECEEYSNNRWSVFSDAFYLHETKKYILSIPIFLIQTEGIFKDFFGIELYSKKEIIKNKKNEILNLECDSFERSIFNIIKENVLNSNEENVKDKCVLNRHSILHGNSLDYGTELNSYRIISLLYCIIHFKSIINFNKIPQEKIDEFKNQIKQISDNIIKEMTPKNNV